MTEFPADIWKVRRTRGTDKTQMYRAEWPLKIFGQSFYGQGLGIQGLPRSSRPTDSKASPP